MAGRSQFFDAAGRHLPELQGRPGHLSSAICGKAWPVSNASGRFAKGQVTLDLAAWREPTRPG